MPAGAGDAGATAAEWVPAKLWWGRRRLGFGRLLLDTEQFKNPLPAHNKNLVVLVGFGRLCLALGMVDVACLLELDLHLASLDAAQGLLNSGRALRTVAQQPVPASALHVEMDEVRQFLVLEFAVEAVLLRLWNEPRLKNLASIGVF